MCSFLAPVGARPVVARGARRLILRSGQAVDGDVGGPERRPHRIGIAAEPGGAVLRLGEERGGPAVVGARGGDGAGEEEGPVDGEERVVGAAAQVRLQHVGGSLDEVDTAPKPAGRVQRVRDGAEQRAEQDGLSACCAAASPRSDVIHARSVSPSLVSTATAT